MAKRGPAKGTRNSPNTEWRPGQSGNPGGRPKYSEISNALRHILSLPAAEKFVPETKAEEIAMSHVKKAKNSTKSFEIIADRAEGKPIQKQSHSLEGGIGVQIIRADQANRTAG